MKESSEVFGLLAQHNLIAPAEDFHLVHVELELFGQAHGLGIAAFEDFGGLRNSHEESIHCPYILTMS